jgi:ribonuclease HI
MRYIKGFFDGSCEPVNPGGTAKWGFVTTEDEEMLHGQGGYIGSGEGMTNNIAEYEGLIHLLKYLVENHSTDFIEVFGDSKMVVLMTNGTWGKKKPHKNYPHLQERLLHARKLFSSFDNISITWIPREQNQLADYYSKQ